MDDYDEEAFAILDSLEQKRNAAASAATYANGHQSTVPSAPTPVFEHASSRTRQGRLEHSGSMSSSAFYGVASVKDVPACGKVQGDGGPVHAQRPSVPSPTLRPLHQSNHCHLQQGSLPPSGPCLPCPEQAGRAPGTGPHKTSVSCTSVAMPDPLPTGYQRHSAVHQGPQQHWSASACNPHRQQGATGQGRPQPGLHQQQQPQHPQYLHHDLQQGQQGQTQHYQLPRPHPHRHQQPGEPQQRHQQQGVQQHYQQQQGAQQQHQVPHKEQHGISQQRQGLPPQQQHQNQGPLPQQQHQQLGLPQQQQCQHQGLPPQQQHQQQGPLQPQQHQLQGAPLQPPQHQQQGPPLEQRQRQQQGPPPQHQHQGAPLQPQQHQQQGPPPQHQQQGPLQPQQHQQQGPPLQPPQHQQQGPPPQQQGCVHPLNQQKQQQQPHSHLPGSAGTMYGSNQQQHGAYPQQAGPAPELHLQQQPVTAHPAQKLLPQERNPSPQVPHLHQQHSPQLPPPQQQPLPVSKPQQHQQHQHPLQQQLSGAATHQQLLQHQRQPLQHPPGPNQQPRPHQPSPSLQPGQGPSGGSAAPEAKRPPDNKSPAIQPQVPNGSAAVPPSTAGSAPAGAAAATAPRGAPAGAGPPAKPGSSSQLVKYTAAIALEDGKRFAVKVGFHEGLKAVFSLIAGATTYDQTVKGWTFPLSQYNHVMDALKDGRLRTRGVQLTLQPGLPDFVCRMLSAAASRQNDERLYDKLMTRPQRDLESLDERMMPFQREGVRHALRVGGRVLIGDEMGLGKTVQACCLIRCYSDEVPALVVVPKSLRDTWADALFKWLSMTDEDVFVVNNAKEVEKVCGPKAVLKPRVVVVSYDSLLSAGDQLKLLKPRMVVLDEAHYIKNGAAKRTQAALPLLKEARRAILLTGTPALSKPIELVPLLQALMPSANIKQADFAERYSVPDKRYPNRYLGTRNEAELNRLLLGTVMVRRLKKDVLSHLPPKRRQQIFVRLPEKDMRRVADMTRQVEGIRAVADSMMSGQGNSGSGLQGIAREQQQAIMQMWRETAALKAAAVADYCAELLEGDGAKFLLFAHHQIILDAVEKKVVAAKAGYIRIDGSVSGPDRAEMVKRFQEDADVKVAILSIKAAGVGLTMTASSLVVFGELSWVPGDIQQAEDRCHRIGQHTSVNIHFLLVRDSVDEIMWDTVQNKLGTVGKVLDGTGAFIKVDATKERRSLGLGNDGPKPWELHDPAAAEMGPGGGASGDWPVAAAAAGPRQAGCRGAGLAGGAAPRSPARPIPRSPGPAGRRSPAAAALAAAAKGTRPISDFFSAAGGGGGAGAAGRDGAGGLAKRKREEVDLIDDDDEADFQDAKRR